MRKPKKKPTRRDPLADMLNDPVLARAAVMNVLAKSINARDYACAHIALDLLPDLDRQIRRRSRKAKAKRGR